MIEHVQRRLQWRRDETPEIKLAKLEQVLQVYRFSLDEIISGIPEVIKQWRDTFGV